MIMKKVFYLLICLLFTLNSNSQEWQTWTGKGLLVNNWEDPAPADDANDNHWYSENFDDSNWSAVQIPIESFQEYGAYYVRTSFTLPDDYEEYEWKLTLRTDDGYKLYLNGKLISEESGCQDNKIILDKSLLKKQGNVIAAVVYDSGGGGQYFYLNYGGITSSDFNGFKYELEDGVVSVSTIDGYEYSEDAKFESSVIIQGQMHNVTHIKSMTHLKNVYIPQTIISIAEAGRWGTFGGNVSSIFVDENNPSFTVIDGSLYTKDKKELLWGANNKEIIVPEGVRSISPYSFYGCDKLESIQLPSTLEGSLHRVFAQCTKLKSIRIPKDISSIEYLCFNGCVSLQSLYLNTSLPYDIDDGVFGGNEKSCVLYVPVGSKELYKDYKYWSNFANIIEDESLVATDISNIQHGFIYNIEENGTVAVSDLNINYNDSHYILENVEIKGQVYPVRKLHRITHLSEFTIPYFITSIESGRWGTFDTYYNRQMTLAVDENSSSFVMNEGSLYTKDMKELLWGANNKEVNVPDGVTSIAAYAFWGCDNLEKISLPSSLQGTLHRVFESCGNLKSIIIPNGVRCLDYLCFSGCTNLESISMPASIESLGSQIFGGCKKLSSVTIPKNCTLGDKVFIGCTGLREIINCAHIPQLINSNVFREIDKSKIILKVPYGSKALYEIASVWKDFGTIEEMKFYAGDKEANFGKQMVLPIYLNNDESVCGFQFDIELPEGFSIATSGRKATYVISAGAERFAGLDHTVTSSLQEDGSVRVLCSSITNANINDDCKDAPVINITINVDASVAPADYMVKLKNITLARFVDAPIEVNLPDAYSTITVLNAFPVTATSSNDAWGTTEITGDNYDSETGNAVIGTDVTLTATPANGYAFVNWTENGEEVSAENPLTFTVNEERNLVAVFTMLGDVYENNVVNVTDLSATVGIILNRTTPTRREYVAANIDNDDKIDVADYSNIAAIILNGGVSAAKSDDFTKYVINMQYDMHIPAGLKINADDIAVALRQTALAKNHSIVTRELENGDVRVLVLSMQNEEIADAKAMLEEIAMPTDKATGEYNIMLSNIILAYNDLSKEEVSMMNQKLMLTSPTGIDLIPTLTKGEGASYNLNGQKLQKAKKGVNIIDGKKYIIK